MQSSKRLSGQSEKFCSLPCARHDDSFAGHEEGSLPPAILHVVQPLALEETHTNSDEGLIHSYRDVNEDELSMKSPQPLNNNQANVSSVASIKTWRDDNGSRIPTVNIH